MLELSGEMEPRADSEFESLVDELARQRVMIKQLFIDYIGLRQEIAELKARLSKMEN